MIKIQTKAQARELNLLVHLFLQAHTEVQASIVWQGVNSYPREVRILGIGFRLNVRRKVVRVGWKLEHISGQTWILEDGALAVKVGRNAEEIAAPVGTIVGRKQHVNYVPQHTSIDSSYMNSVLEALRQS